MKLALITDIHFGCRGSSTYFLDRYEDFFVNQFFPELKEKGITTVLIGGDTWEDRRYVTTNALFRARKMFFDIAKEQNIKLIAILGNHDVAFKNTNIVHSLDIMEAAYPNLHVIYDEEIINFDGCDIALVSWINKENYVQRLQFIKRAKASILLGHFEISGFEMTKGHECEGGLSQSLFASYDDVWSGHFHIKSKKGNITYLGNPFQTNKGDIGYERGYHVFDTDARNLEFIKNKVDIFESIHFNDSISFSTFNFEYYKDKIVVVYVHSLIDCNQKLLALFVEKLQTLVYALSVDELHGAAVNFDVDIEDIDIKTTREIIVEYVTEAIIEEEKHPKILAIMDDLYAIALATKEEV